MRRPILLPEQHERHAQSFQFLMQVDPVRHDPVGGQGSGAETGALPMPRHRDRRGVATSDRRPWRAGGRPSRCRVSTPHACAMARCGSSAVYFRRRTSRRFLIGSLEAAILGFLWCSEILRIAQLSISVQLSRNPRSRSPESVFSIAGIGVQDAGIGVQDGPERARGDDHCRDGRSALQKALWANIVELRLADNRRRQQQTMLTVGLGCQLAEVFADVRRVAVQREDASWFAAMRVTPRFSSSWASVLRDVVEGVELGLQRLQFADDALGEFRQFPARSFDRSGSDRRLCLPRVPVQNRATTRVA